MRYIKVFLLVLLFFVVMMLFVQNQASFSDMVTLKFDPIFAPALTSIPLPRYALLLLAFALGALVVLLMLMWDRLSLSSRLGSSRRRAASFQKQLEKANAQIQKLAADKKGLEAAVKTAGEEKVALEKALKAAGEEKDRLAAALEKATAAAE